MSRKRKHTTNDPSTWTVLMLRGELKRYGLSTHGSQQKLIERMLSVLGNSVSVQPDFSPASGSTNNPDGENSSLEAEAGMGSSSISSYSPLSALSAAATTGAAVPSGNVNIRGDSTNARGMPAYSYNHQSSPVYSQQQQQLPIHRQQQGQPSRQQQSQNQNPSQNRNQQQTQPRSQNRQRTRALRPAFQLSESCRLLHVLVDSRHTQALQQLLNSPNHAADNGDIRESLWGDPNGIFVQAFNDGYFHGVINIGNGNTSRVNSRTSNNNINNNNNSNNNNNNNNNSNGNGIAIHVTNMDNLDDDNNNNNSNNGSNNGAAIVNSRPSSSPHSSNSASISGSVSTNTHANAVSNPIVPMTHGHISNNSHSGLNNPVNPSSQTGSSQSDRNSIINSPNINNHSQSNMQARNGASNNTSTIYVNIAPQVPLLSDVDPSQHPFYRHGAILREQWLHMRAGFIRAYYEFRTSDKTVPLGFWDFCRGDQRLYYMYHIVLLENSVFARAMINAASLENVELSASVAAAASASAALASTGTNNAAPMAGVQQSGRSSLAAMNGNTSNSQPHSQSHQAQTAPFGLQDSDLLDADHSHSLVTLSGSPSTASTSSSSSSSSSAAVTGTAGAAASSSHRFSRARLAGEAALDTPPSRRRRLSDQPLSNYGNAAEDIVSSTASNGEAGLSVGFGHHGSQDDHHHHQHQHQHHQHQQHHHHRHHNHHVNDENDSLLSGSMGIGLSSSLGGIANMMGGFSAISDANVGMDGGSGGGGVPNGSGFGLGNLGGLGTINGSQSNNNNNNVGGGIVSSRFFERQWMEQRLAESRIATAVQKERQKEIQGNRLKSLMDIEEFLNRDKSPENVARLTIIKKKIEEILTSL